MNARRLVFPSWYYFRTGYGTYFSFLLGVATTFVTIYYLAIDHMPFLKELFPNFWVFSIIGVVVGTVACILVGYAHLKRTQAYSAEVRVGVEANPYTRMTTPGKEEKVSWFAQNGLTHKRVYPTWPWHGTNRSPDIFATGIRNELDCALVKYRK